MYDHPSRQEAVLVLIWLANDNRYHCHPTRRCTGLAAGWLKQTKEAFKSFSEAAAFARKTWPRVTNSADLFPDLCARQPNG